ncbi:hypothetical protein F0P96_19530 [Hymenobacter busanensis]|uniref:Uncharacterized protein n=1 Tax=Hymenobacter busanensis TaxID=2607656 RepID=A0A7L4ZWF6_9BACT|nr:hypothetical protein [Hymenobacter busanensis]KAA9325525.1 hypothetical protein F0P96_19530 [Hymenobacter busanensis]QHJ07804.1 hypothetical protein GUY19_11135 [Hymenobacter busanensis]
MKNRFPLLFGTAALLLAATPACTDRPEVEPQPATDLAQPGPAFSLQRSFYYPATSVSSAIGYAPAELYGTALQSGDVLSFSFQQLHNPQQDMLTFSLDRRPLPAALVGTYSLRSTAVPGGQVGVRYAFTGRAGSDAWGRTYATDFTALEGTFTVSSYDADRRLIGGSYRLLVPDAADPLNPALDDQGKARCRITVEGTFANLPVR